MENTFPKMFIQFYGSVITARTTQKKLSLGQGNVFTGVCLSQGRWLAYQHALHRSHDQHLGNLQPGFGFPAFMENTFPKMFIQFYGSVITARKLSLGQGNVFTGVYLSQGRWLLTSMHHRSHDQHLGGGGLHPGGSASRGGVCIQVEEGLHPGEGVCIKEEGSASKGLGLNLGEGSASRGWESASRGRGSPSRGWGSASRGEASASPPPELGKWALHILLECFLVKN